MEFFFCQDKMALKNLKAHYKRLEAGPALNNVPKNGSLKRIHGTKGIFTYTPGGGNSNIFYFHPEL